jgi:uncharacterized protein YciI
LGEHIGYLQQLFDDQRLLFAGPFLDSAGGLAVINVPNEREAQEIVSKDPAVVHQIFQASLHPWLAAFDVRAGISPKSNMQNDGR